MAEVSERPAGIVVTIHDMDGAQPLRDVVNALTALAPQRIVVDAAGLGRGIFDVLRSLGLPVEAMEKP